MITRDKLLFTLLIASIVMLFAYPVLAEPVKCEQCTKETPCATLFEFKDVKFMHNLYCKVVNGKEVWGSEDEEKFDVFYFESPNRSKAESQFDI